MGSSSYHAIKVGFFDVEVHVEPVHGFEVIAFSEDVVHHLDVRVTFLLVLRCVATYLNSSRVEGRVLVLERTDKDDVFEPLEAWLLTQKINGRLLNIFGVCHSQLVQDNTLFPLLEEPHASVKHLA